MNMWFLLGLCAILYLHYRLDRYYMGNEAQHLLDSYRLPYKPPKRRKYSLKDAQDRFIDPPPRVS